MYSQNEKRMESGSDDEFFDANENFNRSKSVDSPAAKESARQGNSIFYPVSTVVPVDEGDDARKSEITTLPCNMKTECGDALSNKTDINIVNQNKVAASHKKITFINEPETDDTKLIKCTSLDNKTLIHNRDNEISNETLISDSITSMPKGTTNIEINDKTVKLNFHKGNNNNTIVNTINKGLPSNPDDPPPVAPPRKKRNPKKDYRPKELILSGNTTQSHNDEYIDPHIELNTTTNKKEMNKVLERGNSLDVVLNDDIMSRRSGGATSPTTVKPTPKESKIEKTGNLYTRSTSPGQNLTDAEILDQVIIKNLDTGETIPLSLASEKLPECTNPLTMHILRLATEQSDTNIPQTLAEQVEDDGHMSDTSTASGGKMQGKRKKLKKFLGRTVQKIKSVADEVSQQVRKGEDESSSEDEQVEGDDGYIKFKNHRAKKDRLLFNRIKLLQDLSSEQVGHIGAVWTMKFSLCGKLLATAGQDNIVRVWVLKDTVSTFEEMRRKYSHPSGRTSPTGSMTSSNSGTSADDELQAPYAPIACDDNSKDGPFQATPFVMYHGHTSDVLDLSWSKNYFLLSSSMDKTVRLWHISRQECLCCFQHVDFVTAICFHPRDDRYFLSGSLDGKIRLWNIPEKKVALWNEIDGSGTSLVTAANFCQNGKLAVVGTYDGRCIFYDTEKLKYHTQVTVRSSHGKNARGRKISGIEPMPGEDKVLITSNDSRIRLYDLKDHSLYCKYRGVQNESSQIRANFSHDGKLILCGSEDKYVYIWRTHHEVLNVRKDRNDYYESFSAHDAVVTAAIFAPYPHAIVEKPQDDAKVAANTSAVPGTKEQSQKTYDAKVAAGTTAVPGTKEQKPYEIIVAADWQGGVKLYINR